MLQTKDKITVVERLRAYIGSIVEIHLLDEQVIRGRLVQVDEDMMNIFLEDCYDSEGRSCPAAAVMGGSISHINIISLPTYESLEEQVFQLILKNGELTVKEMAKMLNAKPSSIRSALTRLRKNGLVPEGKEKVQGNQH